MGLADPHSFSPLMNVLDPQTVFSFLFRLCFDSCVNNVIMVLSDVTLYLPYRHVTVAPLTYWCTTCDKNLGDLINQLGHLFSSLMSSNVRYEDIIQ